MVHGLFQVPNKHSGAYHARPTYVPTNQDHFKGLLHRALEVKVQNIELPQPPSKRPKTLP